MITKSLPIKQLGLPFIGRKEIAGIYVNCGDRIRIDYNDERYSIEGRAIAFLEPRLDMTARSLVILESNDSTRRRYSVEENDKGTGLKSIEILV